MKARTEKKTMWRSILPAKYPQMPPDQGFSLGAPDCSRYAQRLAQARPGLFQAALAAIEQPFEAAAMRACLDARPAADEAALKRTLRRLRQEVMLRVLL